MKVNVEGLWEPLGLFLAVGLAADDVSGFDLQGELPQGLLGEVVAEVVEERDNFLVALQFVMPESKTGEMH